MRKVTVYKIVDSEGIGYHEFMTEAEARQALTWFPVGMEVHVEAWEVVRP